MSNEEQRKESYSTGLQLAEKSITFDLKPESKHHLSTFEKKKEKPVFITQISPAELSVGETAKFTVTVSGFPKPNVQWFHKGQEITSSSVYTFHQEDNQYTLNISQVQTEYEGEYSCTVSNRFGQSTCSALLHVKVKEIPKSESWFEVTGQTPFFTREIESTQCTEGHQAQFQYKVTGNPLPDVQWFRGSYQIQPSKYFTVVNNPDGSGHLNMKGIQQEDSGLYTCRASNASGEAFCSAELIVFRDTASVTSRQEYTLAQKQKSYKVSMAEQVTESRLYTVNLPGQARANVQSGHQMVYTIGTEDRQSIASEQVDNLQQVGIAAASLQKEQVPHQAAVLQSHEMEGEGKGGSYPPSFSFSFANKTAAHEILYRCCSGESWFHRAALRMYSDSRDYRVRADPGAKIENDVCSC